MKSKLTIFFILYISSVFACKPQSSNDMGSSESNNASPVGGKFSMTSGKNVAYYGIEGVRDIENKMKKDNSPDNKLKDYNKLKAGDQVRFAGLKDSNCLFEFAGNFSSPEYRYYLVSIDCGEAEKKLAKVEPKFSCLGDAKTKCMVTREIIDIYDNCQALKKMNEAPFRSNPNGNGGLCMGPNSTYYSCLKDPCKDPRNQGS